MEITINYGFVKLPRTILDWEWYSDATTSRLYIHLLLKANYTEKNWQGILIKVGEFITSVEKLSIELAISKQQSRTALGKLKKSGYINVQSTNKYSKITLLKSSVYGLNENLSNSPVSSQSTINSQPNHKPITTTKKEEKEKTLEEKKEIFRRDVFQHTQSYSNSFLNSFF